MALTMTEACWAKNKGRSVNHSLYYCRLYISHSKGGGVQEFHTYLAFCDVLQHRYKISSRDKNILLTRGSQKKKTLVQHRERVQRYAVFRFRILPMFTENRLN